MKFPFFASVIVFCIVIWHANNRSRKLEDKRERDFWQTEADANAVRRKSMDDLSYIRIPIDTLQHALSHVLSADPRGELSSLFDRLRALADCKIVNLNGITNTQLKLKYGVANLPLLTEYDQNYTELITLLQEMSQLLSDGGYPEAALTLLTFAIDSGSDIRATYRLAGDISLTLGQPENIAHYIAAAQALESPVKPAILRILEQL